MCNVLVLYVSRTGNTKLMAHAVVKGAQSVQGVEVVSHQIGDPFAVSVLRDANALLLGSPTIYGGIAPEMKSFLQAVQDNSDVLELPGKVGAVFGSYGWDTGFALAGLNSYLTALGITVVANPVSAVDYRGHHGIRIHQDALQRCYALGRRVAQQLGRSHEAGKPT